MISVSLGQGSTQYGMFFLLFREFWYARSCYTLKRRFHTFSGWFSLHRENDIPRWWIVWRPVRSRSWSRSWRDCQPRSGGRSWRGSSSRYEVPYYSFLNDDHTKRPKGQNVLSLGAFCPSGRFVLGRFFWAPSKLPDAVFWIRPDPNLLPDLIKSSGSDREFS